VDVLLLILVFQEFYDFVGEHELHSQRRRMQINSSQIHDFVDEIGIRVKGEINTYQGVFLHQWRIDRY
jgi:hypothetical protein